MRLYCILSEGQESGPGEGKKQGSKGCPSTGNPGRKSPLVATREKPAKAGKD